MHKQLSPPLVNIVEKQKKIVTLLESLKQKPLLFQAFAMMETYLIEKTVDGKETRFRTFEDMEKPTIEGGEGEIGYKKGLENGLDFFISHIKDPLSKEWFIGIHDALTAGITTDDNSEGIPTGFRTKEDGKEAMGLIWGETYSDLGISELAEKKKCDNERYLMFESQFEHLDNENYHGFCASKKYGDSQNIMGNIKTKAMSDTVKLLTSHTLSPLQANRFFTFLLFNYYNDINPIKNSELDEVSTVKAIAIFCQDLDQLHLFVDGNIRSIGIFLLNKLLYDQGLEPSCMKDVNALDCLSIDEITNLIVEGQEEFKKLS